VFLIPNSAMAISDYQAGYDDGYAAAQVSNGVYAIGDACEHQSTQYCNGFLAGYTTEFFTLYQKVPQSVTVHETGQTVVIVHPHFFFHPHPNVIVVHRPFFLHPHPHFSIGPPLHHPPVLVQPHPFFPGHFEGSGTGSAAEGHRDH